MRTAAEMWEYIEEATEEPWITGPEDPYWPIVKEWDGENADPLGQPQYEDLLCGVHAEYDATFIINAREDLPRVLEDAQALRGAYMKARRLLYESGGIVWEAVGLPLDRLLIRTAYLADGFRADLLPESDDDTPHDCGLDEVTE